MFKTLLNNSLFFIAGIALISLLMHLPVFNRDLVGVHVWRQSQTQINIENFAYHDFNILNTKSYNMNNPDQVLRYEFPLMQWVFACFYKLFGNHIFISRFLSFIIGLFSVYGIYKLLGHLFSSRWLSMAGAWAFSFSPVFYYYTVNPLPDNLALCTGIWSLYHFFSFIGLKRNKNLVFSFFFLLLATLSKLPFILYGIPWLLYFIKNIRLSPKNVLFKVGLSTLFLSPALAWYYWVIPQWEGNGIVKGILDTRQSGAEIFHILQSNLISTLPELLVNYGSLLFFLTGLFFALKIKPFRHPMGTYLAFLGTGLLLYFFFEMNMIGTVHDYYLFPFLPLLFILVTYGIRQLTGQRRVWLRYFSYFCLLILPLTAFLRINQRWNTVEPGFNKDLLLYKKELRTCTPPSALCIAGNDNSAQIWPYYLGKRCWNFYGNYFSEDYFNKAYNGGARYLYSDSREIENYTFVQAKLKGLILQKGSIRVWELKE
ncbi:MAG: glycosyltransferase family 39 protein [Bacteroidia bacterium]